MSDFIDQKLWFPVPQGKYVQKVHKGLKSFPLKNRFLKRTQTPVVEKHWSRSLNPMHPTIRGTNQSADIFFQNLEVANQYYASQAVVSVR